jgi:hypothetical protein
MVIGKGEGPGWKGREGQSVSFEFGLNEQRRERRPEKGDSRHNRANEMK